MSFYGQFMSHFTREEQNTEVVKAWAAIGIDTEKSILEQVNTQVRSMTDINGFYPDLYRSWLAFFLRRVTHAFAARTVVTVTNPATSEYPVDIKSSYDDDNPSQLVAAGVKYVQPNNITLVPGSSVEFEAIQGTVVKATGTYSEIITISTNKVDISTLQVKLNGEEIQPVSLMTSWSGLKFISTWVPAYNDKYPDPDNPSPMDPTYARAVHLYDGVDYSHKGDFYLVTADGTATITSLVDNSTRQEKFYKGQYVVYNGKTWNKSLNEPSFLPNQMDKAYAIPFDGYFAHYQEGNLYIKVFPGPSTADPEGASYEVVFIDTDGAQGNIATNSLRYSAAVYDTYGNPVDVVVRNTESTTGFSTTEVGELSSLLRDRLYSAINISSVPEYTAFFDAQPEVGDCLVLSDFERQQLEGNISDPGWIYVYLLDAVGEPIPADIPDPSNPAVSVTNPIIVELLQRADLYRDVASVAAKDPTKVHSVLRLKYLSSTDDTAFTAYATSVANSFYNLNFLKQHGFSLFNDLDLFQILQYIGDMYSSVGLSIEGYHYLSESTVPTMESIEVDSYEGEALGEGYYLWYPQRRDSNNNLVTEGDEPVYDEPIKFVERINLTNPTIADICLYNGGRVVGSHADGRVIIYNSASGYEFDFGKFECFWPMQDKGVLTVGKRDGVRMLAKDCVSGAVRVERYS